ncbi:MAG: 4-alpha-glucanotransferase [Clostridia bacterium]|nr:4-alpha-glucanotransferase [Clostridia bacterium]
MAQSGVLMHISSLPSKYGIGSLGREAFRFVDFVKNSGLSIWQVLPISPTSCGDSPYQGSSTFAGNPYFIDLELLFEDGLLTEEELESAVYDGNPEKVDYSRLYNERESLLRKAFSRASMELQTESLAFAANEKWLRDYAQYMVRKKHFGEKPWQEWDEEGYEIDQHELRYYEFEQYIFFKQWNALKEYANKNGVLLMGDMPIYVALDSADVWANPRDFELDAKGKPVCVAGVPPDYFSENGQRWGNPLYDWKHMEQTGFYWWRERMRVAAKRYNIVRIDHFIGMVRFYSIPAEAETAKEGVWRRGPGIKLFQAVADVTQNLTIIAEDLGIVTQQVKALLKKLNLSGMKVLQFAFGSDKRNPHLPHNIREEAVLYTGTHDNDTMLGWWKNASEYEKENARMYLGQLDESNVCFAMIEEAFASRANTVIIPMQDFLELSSDARMNTPSTVEGNWQWRMKEGQATPALSDRILRLNQLYRRNAQHEDGQ